MGSMANRHHEQTNSHTPGRGRKATAGRPWWRVVFHVVFCIATCAMPPPNAVVFDIVKKVKHTRAVFFVVNQIAGGRGRRRCR